MSCKKWNELPSEVWEIIIDYISEFVWMPDKDINIGFQMTNRHFFYLTFEHEDMFDGWTSIIATYWKNKRKTLKSNPIYQMAKLNNCTLKADRFVECKNCGHADTMMWDGTCSLCGTFAK